MTQWLRKLERELRVTLMRPGAQLTRGQRFVRFNIDLARHARNELRDASATTMAAALTYRTIFGLVPMLVMALIVFRAFGGFDESKAGLADQLYELLDLEIEAAAPVEPGPISEQPIETPAERPTDSWLKRKMVEAVPQASPEGQAAGEAETAANDEARERQRANAEMKQKIDDLMNTIAEGASSIHIGSIGVVGMLVLIWAALGLIVTVEKTFNIIYNAPQGRPWHIRIPIYWAMITLGPVLIWASYYFSNQLVAAADGVPVLGWLIGLGNRFVGLLVTWLLFLLLFKLMPNAHVAIRPAMAGAMVSALAWEMMKAALRWYIDNAVLSATQSALYGSLALIPLLLFWVYLTWIVVLAGLEVTHILQTLPANRMGSFERARPTPVARDPWLVIPVMSAIAEAFDAGKPIAVGEIAERLDAPPTTVAKIADELANRGLLHRLSDEEGTTTLTLALPPSRIRIADLVATGPREDADASSLPGHDLLKQLADAQDKALADVTLARRPDA